MTFKCSNSPWRPRQIAAIALSATVGLNAVLSAKPIIAAGEDSPAATQPATQPGGLTSTISEPENKHVERQAEVALARIATVLDATPPAIGATPTDRALALNLLDTVLHEPAAPGRPAVAAFRAARTQLAIEDMQKTKVTDDSIVVWEIYNMGFVVRTKSVTLIFDLVKMTHLPPFTLDDASTQAIINQCDVLFVSHEHLDHADRDVARAFLDAGKPVLAPNAMWLGEPIHDRLTHLPRDGGTTGGTGGHVLKVRGGNVSLNVVIQPGFQSAKEGPPTENNVYTVTTPEGLRVAHTGDNDGLGGIPPIGTIKPVDILFMKLIPDKLKAKDIMDPFAPRLIVPSHLEEIGHERLNAREPYWRAMERVARFKTPSIVMTWGEHFRYTRPSN